MVNIGRNTTDRILRISHQRRPLSPIQILRNFFRRIRRTNRWSVTVKRIRSIEYRWHINLVRMKRGKSLQWKSITTNITDTCLTMNLKSFEWFIILLLLGLLDTNRHSTGFDRFNFSFIGAGWHDQCPYLIFEYYPLGSLDQYLKRGKFSLNTCYAFLRSLLQAIDYLHYEDLSPTDYFTSHRIRKPIIVHRDIKSSNLLVKNTSELSLCLTDFGLAKILPPVLTVNDFIQIGTYRYMAPELLELAISHTSEALCKVDIYASALVMWEIVGQCVEYPCKRAIDGYMAFHHLFL